MSYDLLLRGGRLVDPAHGVDGRRDVAVSDGRVVAIAEELDEGEARHVIDLSGRAVIPGVVDTHVHIGGYGGRVFAIGHRMVAETGVTTVLDMGSEMGTLIAGMKAEGAGLNVASLLSSTAAFGGRSDADDGEINAALERGLAEGAYGLKLLGGHTPLTPDATARCIATANELGAYVGYHVGDDRLEQQPARDARAAGAAGQRRSRAGRACRGVLPGDGGAAAGGVRGGVGDPG